jgi:hypothetical protein
MKRQFQMMVGVLAVAVAAGCGNTKIVDSWTEPTREPAPVQRIVVVGLTDDAVVKRLFEDTFAKSLRERGNEAVASYTFIRAESATNPDSLVSKLRAAGYQAALTARSLGEEMTETVTRGRAYYIPDYSYYWSSYYTMSYTSMVIPDYTTRTQKVIVEAQLFDLASERLVWATRSKTEKTGKLKETIADYNRAIIAALAKSGWVK